MITCDKGIGLEECTSHTSTICQADTILEDANSIFIPDEAINTIIISRGRNVGHPAWAMIIFLQTLPSLYAGKNIREKELPPLPIIQCSKEDYIL